MSATEEIVRIAAKGDGVTASGRHVARAAPGDLVDSDGVVARGPHHIEPRCTHFGSCGGCQLQHCDEDALSLFVAERVINAAEGQGVEIAELLPAHLSPPNSRRRCTLHARRAGNRIVVGFTEARSHKIVDLRECHILRPELFALVEPLRRLLTRLSGNSGEIELTLLDQGISCAIKGFVAEGLEATEEISYFARKHSLARLSLDHGYGPETAWEPEPVTITLSGFPIGFPHGAFLQPTLDGEQVLASLAAKWLQECTSVADLFSGLGTFSFAMPTEAKVLAVEAARDAVMDCQRAANQSGRSIKALHRDLFRNPLQPAELGHFDAVLLDPPRAGAREQCAQIADSDVKRVVYISCNPSSWARDARTLAEAGFRCEAAKPVGQFTWSTHVELASLFTR